MWITSQNKLRAVNIKSENAVQCQRYTDRCEVVAFVDYPYLPKEVGNFKTLERAAQVVSEIQTLIRTGHKDRYQVPEDELEVVGNVYDNPELPEEGS